MAQERWGEGSPESRKDETGSDGKANGSVPNTKGRWQRGECEKGVNTNTWWGRC